ncbi:dipeptidase [Flavobacterium sp. LM4]|uniref:dipeptidase n=1 Tax=Flavobacterium sp. LM4 TaxID=1938609 RepID=UPI00099412CA|nr:membrane dipeptidase [Flavobacterium sp. LM4]OOV20463.1 peptidase M19 [Flavobacterium sp. LM4]
MENNNQHWSRRKFINILTGTGTLLLLNPLLGSWDTITSPRIMKRAGQTMGIDTHNHIDVPLDGTTSPEMNNAFTEYMKVSGLSAIVMTFAVDYQRLTEEGQAYSRFLNGIGAMDKLLENNNIKRALDYSALEQAYQKKQPIVIQSVEGGHFLEGKIERLQIAYDRGLRHLGLLHDNDASVPLGDIYTNPPKWGGLTDFGAKVIQECNRLGILIDLTHCSNDTINAALKVSSKPIMISHTGLDTQLGSNATMAKMMQPRLISKVQAKIVANAGGVIGAWTHLADSSLEYAQNIRALVDVVGIDHVCIGTDTKLTSPYRPPFNPNSQSQGKLDDKKEDIPNERKNSEKNIQSTPPNIPKEPNGERIGERTNLIWKDQKQGFYFEVVDALIKTGFSDSDIAKIGGGNFARVFDEATKIN